MNLLARREHSRAELHSKLRHKGFDVAIIENVVADLVRDNLVDDERFTEGYVRYRLNRGFGPLRVQIELRERGIDDALIDKYVDASGEHWLDRITTVQSKKFGNMPNDFQERARQARFLQYRGFTSEQIRLVLKSED